MFVPFAKLSAKQISKVTDEERRVANKQAREQAEIEAGLKNTCQSLHSDMLVIT